MNGRNKLARSAGHMLDHALGEAPGGDFLKRQSDRLVASLASRPRRTRRYRPAAVAAAAGFALIAAVAVFRLSSPSITYRVDGGEAMAGKGHSIENGEADRLPIVFENGSRFELFSQSTAQVMAADEERVVLDLKSGRVSADIKGNGITAWLVTAGPYRVKVMGTRFDVTWDDRTQKLDVEVTSGHVQVDETTTGKNAVALVSGRSLHADRRTGQILITSRDAPPALESQSPEAISPKAKTSDVLACAAEDQTALVPSIPADANATAEEDAKRPAAKVAAPAPWKRLVSAKEWRRAAQEASSEDLLEMERKATSDELWYLANAERHLRRAEPAARLFEALINRFPGSSRAQTALFLLGKTAIELSGDKATARRWFTRYVQEVEKGALREEALGHLMEIHLSLGDFEGAKSCAIRYLSEYKGGIFQDRAKSIIAR